MRFLGCGTFVYCIQTGQHCVGKNSQLVFLQCSGARKQADVNVGKADQLFPSKGKNTTSTVEVKRFGYILI